MAATVRSLAFASLLCICSTHSTTSAALVPPFAARGPSPLERRASMPARAPRRTAPDYVFLDNGVVRLGVDVAIGGAIGWLSKSGSDANVVHAFETGRYV